MSKGSKYAILVIGVFLAISTCLTSPAHADLTCSIQTSVATGDAPLTVEFNVVTDGSIRRYWWDFGDGTAANDVCPVSHTYDQPGIYIVRLTVRDSNLVTAKAKPIPIRVSPGQLPDPSCVIMASEISGDGPLIVNFETLGIGTIRRLWWDFGDGTAANDVSSPSHTYTQPGMYIVRLTVRDSNLVTARAEPVTIIVSPNELPEPSCYIQASVNTGDAPLTVNFSAICVGAIRRFWWDFGDNTVATDVDRISHTYTEAGIYIVRLSVRGRSGVTTQAEPVAIIVSPNDLPQPSCTIQASVTAGETPLTVNFKAVCLGAIRRFWWDFGDNTVANDVDTVSHTYTEAGVYVVRLSIRDRDGNMAQAIPVAIIAGPDNLPSPSCAIVASSNTGDSPLTVKFDAAVTGAIRRYWWDFGDDTGARDVCPTSHTYSQKGVYIVRLTVRDRDSNMAHAEPVAIIVSPNELPQPSCYIQASQLAGDPPLDVNFKAIVVGSARRYWWDFGDDTGARDVDVISHTYTTSGVYSVALSIRDQNGNMAHATAVEIEVYDNVPPTEPTIDPVTSPTNASTQVVTGVKSEDTEKIIITSSQATIGDASYLTATTWSCAVTLREGNNDFSVKAEDAAENQSGAVTFSIVLDTASPTGTIKINNDDPHTGSRDVTLNLSAQDNAGGSGVDKMQFSNDNTNWSELEDYADTKNWTLAEGDGQKTVYAKLKDKADNCTDPAVSDSILLDTTPPVIQIISPQGGDKVTGHSN